MECWHGMMCFADDNEPRAMRVLCNACIYKSIYWMDACVCMSLEISTNHEFKKVSRSEILMYNAVFWYTAILQPTLQFLKKYMC